MTPETVIRPFLKYYELPDSLVRRLYHLLQHEIEHQYPSLANAPDPAIRFAKGLDHIFSKLPPIFDVDNRLHATIYQLGGFSDSDVKYLYSLRANTELKAYYTERQHLKDNIDTIDRYIPNLVKEDVPEARRMLRHAKDQLRELKEPDPTPYLTRFWLNLLDFNVSFDIPKRNRHCHIIGQSGVGKTDLLKRLICHDIQSGASVIAMAPKGDLIETVATFPSDRTIWLKDWTQVGLNLADLDRHLMIYVFEGLLDSAPTPKQKAFLGQYVPRVKSLSELRTIKVEKDYEETAKQINWRLDLMPEVMDEILSRPTNIDIQDIMDSGKVLLLDTKHLGEGSSFIGRFFIALIARITRDRKSRHPVYIYIDEAQKFLTEYIEDLLDMAREANVGLTLCHQNLAQFTPRLTASVHNTAIKFVGKCNSSDSGAMAREIRVLADDIQTLPDYTFMFSAFKKPFHVSLNKFVFTASHREHFTSPRPETKKESTDDPGTEAWVR